MTYKNAAAGLNLGGGKHVISTLKAHHIPLVTTSGGGYQKAWHNVVDGHEQLFHAVMTHHSDAFV